MDKIMKPNTAQAIIFAIIIMIFAAGFWSGWHFKQCPEVLSQSVNVRDSIVYKDTSAILAISGKPKKVKTSKFNGNLKTESKSDSTRANIAQVENSCRDTNYYETLTYYPDSFRARMSATVTGNELIDVAVQFQNLKPDVIKIIDTKSVTPAKQSLVKAFATAYGRASFNPIAATGGGAGGGFDFIIKEKVLIGFSGGANIEFQQPIRGEAMLRCGIGLGK
jgi:hypothetical protein